MEKHTPRPNEWIAGYLGGTLPEDEKKRLAAWIQEDDSHKRYYYELTELWLAARASENKSRPEAFRRFVARTRRHSGKRLYRFAPYLRVAAVLVIGILLGATAFYLHERRQPASPFTHTLEVPYGSKSRVVLADGTRIWLNAGSRFSYSSDFFRTNREVELQGEGYFEVARHEGKPFTVHTQGVAVQVLGTKFNVHAYTDEPETAVTLAEGSIRFIRTAQPDSSLVLQPGEQAVYDKSTGHTSLQKVDAETAGNWITGTRFFNELTFETIARQLEKAYGVTFVFRNEQARKLVFYGEFRPEETLDDILYVMASSRKFTYTKKDNVIEIN